MPRSLVRSCLFTTPILALLAAAPAAMADGTGTPTQPPAALPPSQPLPPPPLQQPQQPQAQGLARPQPAPPYAAYQRDRQKRSHWYGWQTLIVDGAWLVGGILLAPVDPSAGGAVLLGGYLLGGPIVHWSHGRVGMGFADFGIRIGAPLVLSLIGFGVTGGKQDAAVAGAVVGFVLGLVGAIVIDSSVLAYEREDDEGDAMRKAPPRNALLPATIRPLAAPRTEGGFVLGLSGTL